MQAMYTHQIAGLRTCEDLQLAAPSSCTSDVWDVITYIHMRLYIHIYLYKLYVYILHEGDGSTKTLGNVCWPNDRPRNPLGLIANILVTLSARANILCSPFQVQSMLDHTYVYTCIDNPCISCFVFSCVLCCHIKSTENTRSASCKNGFNFRRNLCARLVWFVSWIQRCCNV